MDVVAPVRRVRRVFYGWWIVMAAGAMSMYGAGVWFYGFSVLFKPIKDEFGWSRAVTAGAFSMSRLEGGLVGPVAGWFIDKFGPRRLAVVGAFVAGLGFVSLHWVNSLVMFYVIFTLVIAVGYNAGFFSAGTAAIANWFIKRRSRALSIYALGAGIGGGAIVPLLGWLIAQYGWRTTVVLIGLGFWLFAIPMALLLRHKPEQYGYLPDGVSPQEGAEPIEQEEAVVVHGEESLDKFGEVDFTARETLRTGSFWLFVTAGAARSLGMTAVVVHEVTYLTEDVGIAEETAAFALGLMVLASIPGRIFFGWLGDIFPKRFVLATCYSLQALGIFILANAQSIGHVYLFLAVYGPAYGGAIPVYMAMRGEYFGRKAFATIGGITQLILTVPTVTGPIFAGYIYDTSGSYYIAFMTFMAFYLLGAVIMSFTKRPSPRAPATTMARP